jgi:asparagine synthase (glutamine-hydrolysing)
MCGIAGIINQNGLPVDPLVLRRMTDLMYHRGPNAAGAFVEGAAALGHRRLSIIDLSAEANQPMADSSGRYRIVFNGEIYNYLEVKAGLNDYFFQTQSDTEVILAAYLKWGVACLEHFNGMFAFAIWDREEQILFLARDRVGKKPLYYYRNEHTFLFASEVRALLSTGLVPRQIRPDAVATYLKYQTVPAPDTLIENVFQLPAGHYALVHRNQFSLHSYWSLLQPTRHFEKEDAAATRRQVKTLLQAAVGRRMVSDVPLGAFLSGGIDSSAVVALMAEQSEQPINTFSINFQERAYDESAYSDLIARRFKTRHTPFQLSAGDFLNELPAILGTLDMPSGDGPNTYIVSKLTKQAGVTVALTGLGGDELFAGYETFKYYTRLRQFGWFWRLPVSVRSSMHRLLQVGVNRRQAGKMAELVRLSNLEPQYVLPLFRQSMPPNLIGQLLVELPKGKDVLRSFFADNQQAISQLPLLS